MQKVCVLLKRYDNSKDLNFISSLLRIPEVSQRLKQAQDFFDQNLKQNQCVDLFSLIQEQKSPFLGNSGLGSFIYSITQVGLFDRYLKFQPFPDYMIGNLTGPTATKVCSHQLLFFDMVAKSEFFLGLSKIKNIKKRKKLTLARGKVSELNLLENSGQKFVKTTESSYETTDLLEVLTLKNSAIQYVVIDPCPSQIGNHNELMSQYSILNSIDLDPILNSFWRPATA